MPIQEWTSRPLKELIRSIATSVAEGQEELDRRSLRVQQDLEKAVEAGELSVGLDASWLRFSDVEANIQLEVAIEGEEIRDSSGSLRAYKPIVRATPINPRTRQQFDVDAELTSDITLTIVPVPPEQTQP